MIEKLSGAPTQKCNLLSSNHLYLITHTLWTSVTVKTASTSLPHSFTFFFQVFLPVCVCVCVCVLYYCTIRERRRWGNKRLQAAWPPPSWMCFSLKLEIIHLTPTQQSTYTDTHTEEHLCNACRAMHTHDGMYICSHTHMDMERIGFLILYSCIASVGMHTHTDHMYISTTGMLLPTPSL